jgi:hypothetical protein
MKFILEWCKKNIGEAILAMLIAKFLTPENIKIWLADLLEYLEGLAKTSETKIDDKAIAIIRIALQIPDADGDANAPTDPPAPPAQ